MPWNIWLVCYSILPTIRKVPTYLYILLFSNIVSVGGEDKTELKSTHFSDGDSKSIFTTSFNELDPDKEYEICVSTNYNGQEVAKSMTKILKTLPDNPSDYAWLKAVRSNPYVTSQTKKVFQWWK